DNHCRRQRKQAIAPVSLRTNACRRMLLSHMTRQPLVSDAVTVYAPRRRHVSKYRLTPTETQAAVGGAAAAIAFGIGMLVLRSTIGVRSIPERLMEWLLLFIPPGLFEAVLQRLGFDAKRYGLDFAILLVLAGLAWLGYEALWRGWSLAPLGGLGPRVWLVLVRVIMPLTQAGLFASAVVEGATAAVLGYLAASLSYAAVLMIAALWIRFDGVPESVLDVPERERRILLVSMGGLVAAYVATFA